MHERHEESSISLLAVRAVAELSNLAEKYFAQQKAEFHMRIRCALWNAGMSL